MRKNVFGMALLAGLSFGCLETGAQAAPQIGAAMLDDSAPNALLQTVQVEVRFYAGRRYCFYFDGWHGPGWYRCGWAWRRGYGWGGVYGWNDWIYAPAARRFGHRGFRDGERYRRGEIRGDRYGRPGGEIRGDRRGRGDTEFRGDRGERGPRAGGPGGTTGQGTVGPRGGAAIQGGPGGGPGGRGGGPGGGGPGGGPGIGAGGGGGGGAGGGGGGPGGGGAGGGGGGPGGGGPGGGGGGPGGGRGDHQR